MFLNPEKNIYIEEEKANKKYDAMSQKDALHSDPTKPKITDTAVSKPTTGNTEVASSKPTTGNTEVASSKPTSGVSEVASSKPTSGVSEVVTAKPATTGTSQVAGDAFTPESQNSFFEVFAQLFAQLDGFDV